METAIAKFLSESQKVIKGKQSTVKLCLASLISDGHILIEDLPGSGKTTLAITIGKLIDFHGSNSKNKFKRIQFTPDLLPSDILGVNVFNPENNRFEFHPGPIFANIILADEINRSGPKVQSALLECMAEKQVTIDNESYKIDDVFLVIGTQNPLDIAGTYPLPIAELDRFLVKIPMTYVDKKIEVEIVSDSSKITKNLNTLKTCISRDEILSLREMVRDFQIDIDIIDALVNICRDTREDERFRYGASTRAAIALKKILAACAIIDGRDNISEDDIKEVTPYVLGHRVQEKSSTDDKAEILEQIISKNVEPIITKLWR